MRPPRGRNVEVDEQMLPVGGTWAGALAYCAFVFALFWIAVLGRGFVFIAFAGLLALSGFAALFHAMRATLDARAFGAMRLRAAAPPARAGGRFLGSLRISESAAVRGTVCAELRCNEVWYDGKRNEQTIWSQERSFPIRRQVGGSYAILEFDIPPEQPPSEAPPAGGLEHGRRYARWEIQAYAEAPGAYRDELYAITVQPGEAAAAPRASDPLPLEVIRRAPPPAPGAQAPKAAAHPLQIIRAAAPKPRTPKPVEEALDLAEVQVLPPARPDPAAIALLVAANLVPLAGVAFWNWQVAQVVFVYWMENLVIGAFNVLRILAMEPKAEDDARGTFPVLGKLFLAAFFTVHYGAFCAGHGVFLAGFFGREADGGFGTVSGMLARMLHEPVVIAALAALLVSHGWSFFRNYLGRGEYHGANGEALMKAPYKRIVVTHIFILVGGFLLMALKSQLLPMLLFVGLKIGCDVHFHRSEHRGQSGA